MSFSPAMISSKALGAMPTFAANELGEKKTLRLLSDAGLLESFMTERHGFIPEYSLCAFIEGVSRALGEDRLGLLFAPYLTVADYGAWGDYVLSAPDLGTALKRAQQEMKLHSSTDRVEFVIFGNLVSYTYSFGLRSHSSYPDIAFSAVASMLSIPRHYLGQNWSPAKIEFDFPKSLCFGMAEEVFGCPVSFGGSCLRLLFDTSVLSTPGSLNHSIQFNTRHDIIRERSTPPEDMLTSVNAVVELHVADGGASLERLAQAMGVGPRRLQRHLAKQGTGFREVLVKARMERAVELLMLKGSSVGTVSEALGYNEPGNFTRAFTQHFGASPTKYLKGRDLL